MAAIFFQYDKTTYISEMKMKKESGICIGNEKSFLHCELNLIGPWYTRPEWEREKTWLATRLKAFSLPQFAFFFRVVFTCSDGSAKYKEWEEWGFVFSLSQYICFSITTSFYKKNVLQNWKRYFQSKYKKNYIRIIMIKQKTQLLYISIID